ncbi:MAG: CPBP family intramembrane glutamic endopeptidase [Chitinophagales bacterium]|nr:CPBP family intramembrane glutamic endopeptidase [Chitinophagales bacterium]
MQPHQGGFAITLLLLFWFLGSILFSSLQEQLAEMLIGSDAMDRLTKDADFLREHVWFMRLLQPFYTILGFLLPPLIMAQMLKLNVGRHFRLRQAPRLPYLGMMLLIFIASLPLISYTASLNQQLALPDFLSGLERASKDMAEQLKLLTQAMLRMDSPIELVINLVVFAILPGIAEELYFRGGVQRIFHTVSRSAFLGIFLSALFFTIIHFDIYGLLPRFLLGMMLGYLYHFSGNLWLPIIAHVLFNGSQVIAVYFTGLENFENAEEQAAISIWVALGSLLIVLTLFWWFYKSTRTQKTASP